MKRIKVVQKNFRNDNYDDDNDEDGHHPMIIQHDQRTGKIQTNEHKQHHFFFVNHNSSCHI